ncbi:guanine nucleotide binding protein, alpha subunit [Abortiporus biennis]|nr:guanine nucleotide binding protein, alpha subunit [Abortiporus biennis]
MSMAAISLRSQRRSSTAQSTKSPVTPPSTWPPVEPTLTNAMERAIREEEEKEAKRVSDAIDAAIEQDRHQRRKAQEARKILLLGQAESGKSTILKQFQLFYTPKAFQAEKEAWRAVIHLNLVRSVNFILDVVSGTITLDGSSPNIQDNVSIYSNLHRSWATGGSDSTRAIRMRLSPLRQVEMILARRLSADMPSSPHTTTNPFVDAGPYYYGKASEVAIRGGTAWKSLVDRRPSKDRQLDDLDDARKILHACKDDIVHLWENEEVQNLLHEQGLFLEDLSGFFLDQTERIASLDYKPSVSDIFKARLQTKGVEEHNLVMEINPDIGQTWRFFDVGGSKGQRAAWAPYFDDVNGVIFLSPISSFNQMLTEDRTMNRMLDSFTLWKTIASSKLLNGVPFVLLLNKCDLLDRKLRSGIIFSEYVKSYNGPNTFENVAAYLKNKFVSIHKTNAPKKRLLHVHLTCAIDRNVMENVIVRIREAVLVEHLMASDLL